MLPRQLIGALNQRLCDFQKLNRMETAGMLPE